MPRRLLPASVRGELAASLAALRAQLDLPGDFGPDALAEAAATEAVAPERDLRSIPFITIDPAGARDLDQALALQRSGAGYRVHYAIADVPAFVRPGGAIDAEARRRGQTLYGADGTVPLHPRVLSEDRASLLPDVDRPAFAWTFDLDGSGAVTRARIERALVRSRAQWDYDQAQEAVDRGDLESPVALLPEIGELRLEQERLRGGASLDLPDEQIVSDGEGGYRIERRMPRAVERWNAQLSLLTGMTAAAMMLDARTGILRTMPPPAPDAVVEFRAKTEALGLGWPADQPYGEYLRTVDASTPTGLAVLEAASGLFRGAGYAAFDGGLPQVTTQAAVAAPYAHVTAPLRRLVDRWGLVVCEAVSDGRAVPEWVRSSLAEVPALMESSAQRASRFTAGTLDRVEAAVLSGRVGDVFEAVVVEVRNGRARLQLDEPVVTASCPVPDSVEAGERVRVRLEAATIANGEVRFALAG